VDCIPLDELHVESRDALHAKFIRLTAVKVAA
jgi:hypothetical protein